MTSLEEYAAVRTPLPAAPKGWEPVVEQTGTAGIAKNILAPEGADDRRLMEEAGLDPDAYRITGGRKHRRWQMMGEWQHYWAFNFDVRVDEDEPARQIDIEELKALFKKKPPVPCKITEGDDAFVFVISDWQIGKMSEHTIDFLRERIQAAKIRIKELRKAGRQMPTGVVLTLGDIVEGCGEHYAQQSYLVDLDRRGQVKVARRLIREVIGELAPLFSRFVISGIGGNHGENRREGKSFTTFADNDDVAILEMLQEVLVDRPGFEHVEFYIPDDELSACIEVGGVNVGFTHGHLLTRGGTLPQAKALEWWKGQIMGLGAVANAQILVTGHFHHLTVSTHGPRTHLQAPACDGGSKWYADLTGATSPDGVLTFRVNPRAALGWDDLLVL